MDADGVVYLSDVSDDAASSGPSGSDFVPSEEDEEIIKPARGPKRGAGSAGAKRAATAPAAAPKPKRKQPAVKLGDLLKSASKHQLVSLLLNLNEDAEGTLEASILDLLPPPDLTGMYEELSMLERKVDKAFPHVRWGTNSDAYAYKRVGPHLRDLKATLLEHARMLSQGGRHDSLLDYLGHALGVVDRMPCWDADAHNKPKAQTAKALEGMLVKAVKAACLSPAKLAALRSQVEGLHVALPNARRVLGAAK